MQQKNRRLLLFLACGILSIAACSVQRDVPPAPVFGLDSRRPPISKLIQMLQNHPLTIYDSSEDSFILAVGGAVNARYRNGTLYLNPPETVLSPELECQYSASGLKNAEQLIITPNGKSRKAEWCEGLLRRLDQYLWAQSGI